MSIAETRARAWYGQLGGTPKPWDELPETRRRLFIAVAGTPRHGCCAAPECGGDCLECYTG